MTIEAGGVPVNATQLSELRSNLGILDFAAGGQSVATSGNTLVFSNSNGLSFGLNAPGGSVLTGSYTVPETSAFLTTAALSNHSHGNPSLALTNLSGSTASNSAGLTISLSAAAPGAGGGAGLSAGTQSVATGTVVFANSNGVSFGLSGSSQITASHNGITSQTVQTQGSVAVLGSTGAISFDNSNGITFGGNASTITASHNGLTTAAISNHSHGNPTLALTNLSGTTASASNGLTISLSAAALAAAFAVSAAGSSLSAGTLVFSNSNGISFGMNGSTITATVNPGAAAGLAAAQAGTQTATSGTLVFANSNGITFGLSGSSQMTASHNGLTAQTAQTLGVVATGNTTQSSSGTIDARSLTLNGLGAVSVGVSNGSVQISSPVQSVQTQGSVAILGSTGAISFDNSNGITFGANASTITASHNGLTTAALSNHSHGNPTLALTNLSGTTASASNGLTLSLSAAAPVAQTNQTIGFFATGNTTQSSSTTFDARSITFNGLGAATLGFSNGSMQVSVPLQTAQTQSNVQGVIVSDTTYRTGDVSFKNANGISFGSSGANGVSASYTVPIQSAQTIGVYGSSNTTGQSSSSTVDARSLSFRGMGVASVGLSAGEVVISVPSGAADGVNIVAAGGRTATTNGTVVFSNSNGISFGLDAINGSQITASYTVPVQSAQTVGVYGSSQTYGQSSSSTVDARSLSFVGSGGVSVGLSGGSVLISGQTTAAQTVQSLGLFASSQTFGQSSSSTIDARSLSIVGSGGVSVGMSAGSLLISGQTTVAQSAQTQSNVQGIVVSNTTYRTGDVSFSNANGISFGSSAGGGVVTASYTVPSVAGFLTTARASNDAIGLNTAQTNVTWTVNSSGISLNAAGYAGTGTSKTGAAVMTLNSNGLQFDGSGLAGTSTGFTGANVSASLTHNSAGLAMSMSVAAPSAATLSGYAVSNTTQSTSGVFPGAISFQGAGGVSVGVSNGSLIVQGPDLSSLSATGALSASSNGSTISLGVGTVTASVIGNTTQTSSGSINLNALVFSGAGAASLGISGGTVIVSAGGGGAAISASGSSQNAGTIVFSNSNGISFGMSGSTITATVTPGAAAGIAALGASNTTYTSGTVSLVAGAGAITIGSQTGQRITFAVPATSSLVGSSGVSVSTAGSTITVGLGTVNASIIGNTTQTSTGSLNLSGLVFSGAGGVSLGVSAGSVIVSGATGGAGGVALSAAGSSQNAGTIVFSNSNGVTFGMNGSTVTASVAAAVGGLGALGASNTTYTSGTVSLVAGAGAITIGSDTGQRITFAVPATSSLVGSNGISISTNGSTISVYQPFLSYAVNGLPYLANSQTQQPSQSTSVVFPIQVREQFSAGLIRLPHSISLASSSFATTANTTFSFNQQETHNLVAYSLGTGASSQSLMSFSSVSASFRMSINVAENSTSQMTVTYGLTYPVSNGTSSQSFSYGVSNASIQISTTGLTALTGIKMWDTQAALALSAGRWWLAYGVSSSSTTQGTNLSGLRMVHSHIGVSQPNNSIGMFGIANAAADAWQQGIGSLSVAGGGTTANLHLSQVSSSASHVAPYIQFINQA